MFSTPDLAQVLVVARDVSAHGGLDLGPRPARRLEREQPLDRAVVLDLLEEEVAVEVVLGRRRSRPGSRTRRARTSASALRSPSRRCRRGRRCSPSRRRSRTRSRGPGSRRRRCAGCRGRWSGSSPAGRPACRSSVPGPRPPALGGQCQGSERRQQRETYDDDAGVDPAPHGFPSDADGWTPSYYPPWALLNRRLLHACATWRAAGPAPSATPTSARAASASRRCP